MQLLLDDQHVNVRVSLNVAGKLRDIPDEAEVVDDEQAAIIPASVADDVAVDLIDHLLLTAGTGELPDTGATPR